MIRFACPTCDAPLSAPQHKCGRVRSCPRCSTLLQVPPRERQSPESVEPEEPPARRDSLLRLVRLTAWVACVGWVSYLAWPHLAALWAGSAAVVESPANAIGVQMIGAYIVARALDSVARR